MTIPRPLLAIGTILTVSTASSALPVFETTDFKALLDDERDLDVDLRTVFFSDGIVQGLRTVPTDFVAVLTVEVRTTLGPESFVVDFSAGS